MSSTNFNMYESTQKATYSVCMIHKTQFMISCPECDNIRRIVKEEVEKGVNGIISLIQNRFAAKEAKHVENNTN